MRWQPWAGLEFTAIVLLGLTASAWGQPGRGYGGSGGGFFPGGGSDYRGGDSRRGDSRAGNDSRGERGDRGGGDRGSRGGFDARGMLERMDENRNGIIDPNEVSGRGGEFIRRMAERAGMNPDQPLPIDKLAASADSYRSDRDRDRGRDDNRSRDERNRDERNRDERNWDERDRGSSSSGSASPAAAPPSGVQAFGAAASPEGPKVPGFDVPLSPTAGPPIEQKFDDRVVEYVRENMLKERDLNKNGVLERNEWSIGRWSTPPEESDLNKDGILSFEELCIRMSKRFQIDNSRGSSSGSGPSPVSPGSSPGSSSANDPARFRAFAESLLRQNDENKSGMLERDEWKNMRSEHQAADANKDGVITVDELAASLQAYSAGGGFSRSGDRSSYGSRSYGDNRYGDSKQPLAKKSYRASTPTERLPKGVPDFFYRNDADADGQISMAEYATAWNDQIAAEFQKLDLNGDGILTPEECVRPGGR